MRAKFASSNNLRSHCEVDAVLLDVDEFLLIRIRLKSHRYTYCIASLGGSELCESVDFGIVRVDLLLALIPLRLVALKLSGALNALIQDRERMLDGSLCAEHVRELEEPPPGLGVNLDVAQELRVRVFGLEVLHERFDLLGLVLDLGEFFRSGLDRRGASRGRAAVP